MPFPVIPPLVVLQQILQALFTKLPDLWKHHTKTVEMERLQTDLHFLVGVIQDANSRYAVQQHQVAQGQLAIIQSLSQGQMTFIQQLIDLLQPRLQQLEFLTSPQASATPAASEEQVSRFVDQVRRSLEPQLKHTAPLSQPEEALDVLTRLVNWQMTSMRLFMTWNTNNIRARGWSILGYYYTRYLYCIAVGGTEPASAQIRYYRSMLASMPDTDDEWRRELEVGVKQFDHFAALPGSGIYDLSVRLHAQGVEVD